METINLPFIEPTAVGATTSVQFGNWVLHNNVYYTNGWIPGDNGEISFYLQESDLEQNINFKYIPTTISKSCKEQAHSPTSDASGESGASGEPENYRQIPLYQKCFQKAHQFLSKLLPTHITEM